MEIVDYQHGNSRLSIRKSHVCNRLMKIGLMIDLFFSLYSMLHGKRKSRELDGSTAARTGTLTWGQQLMPC